MAVKGNKGPGPGARKPYGGQRRMAGRVHHTCHL
jgi:hypothetical protein